MLVAILLLQICSCSDCLCDDYIHVYVAQPHVYTWLEIGCTFFAFVTRYIINFLSGRTFISLLLTAS